MQIESSCFFNSVQKLALMWQKEEEEEVRLSRCFSAKTGHLTYFALLQNVDLLNFFFLEKFFEEF